MPLEIMTRPQQGLYQETPPGAAGDPSPGHLRFLRRSLGASSGRAASQRSRMSAGFDPAGSVSGPPAAQRTPLAAPIQSFSTPHRCGVCRILTSVWGRIRLPDFPRRRTFSCDELILEGVRVIYTPPGTEWHLSAEQERLPGHSQSDPLCLSNLRVSGMITDPV